MSTTSYIGTNTIIIFKYLTVTRTNDKKEVIVYLKTIILSGSLSENHTQINLIDSQDITNYQQSKCNELVTFMLKTMS